MITFGAFLHSIREKRDVSLETLSMGICSNGYLSRIETGERKAPYLLRECLLGRLGISGENFYEYLQPKEYEEWVLRQTIIKDLLYGENKEACSNIEKFRQTLASDDSASYQFFLYSKSQLSNNRSNSLSLLEEAMKCTMGHLIDGFDTYFHDALLSAQEYCILTEYIAARAYSLAKGDKPKCFTELSRLCKIMDKTENNAKTPEIVAQIYPLALYHFCRISEMLLGSASDLYAKERKERCFKAIDFLRKTRRFHYFMGIVHFLGKSNNLTFEEKELMAEFELYCSTFQDIFKEYGIPFCTQSSAYVFLESGAYAIGDVILKRRKMFNMSQKDLCDGICSEKTLSRIENGNTAVQDYVFKMLFERLKLVPDYIHGEIISDDWDAFETYEEIKHYSNAKEYDKAKESIKKLKSKLDMDYFLNKQCWGRTWNNYQLGAKLVSPERYFHNIKKLLMLTVGDPDSIDPDSIDPETVYLNDSEIMLVHNLSVIYKSEDRKKYVKLTRLALRRESDEKFLMSNYNLNAFLSTHIASELGNEASYKDSNLLSKLIIETGLRMGNLIYVSENIYNIWWNAKQCGDVNQKMLDNCLAISQYCNISRKVTSLND